MGNIGQPMLETASWYRYRPLGAVRMGPMERAWEPPAFGALTSLPSANIASVLYGLTVWQSLAGLGVCDGRPRWGMPR